MEITEADAALDSWYGGVLRLPRDRWQWIVFEDVPEDPLFSGPEGLEGWTIGDVSMARVQSGNRVAKKRLQRVKLRPIDRPTGHHSRVEEHPALSVATGYQRHERAPALSAPP